MTAHLGYPIPSPAIMEKMGTSFRWSVRSFADTNHIPIVRFRKGDRKIDVLGRYLAAQAATGRSGVAAIGVAQEYQNVFAATQRERSNSVPWFSFTKADRRVSCFYFYLWDVDFGPAFIKVCAYFPYPIRECSTGMSGPSGKRPQPGSGGPRCPTASPPARTPPRSRDLRPARTRDHPGLLRAVDGRLAVAVDRTRPRRGLLVGAVDAPGRGLPDHGVRRTTASPGVLRSTGGRQLGRPDSIELIFTGHKGRRGPLPKVEQVYKTKVVTRDTLVTAGAFDKHSRVKQYLKDGRALRIETVINSPTDLRRLRRLQNLDELQAKGRDVNARMLNTERVGQSGVLASPAFERVALPTLTADGRRAPALRFGDPRVMALLGALCFALNAVGFTHRSLRAQVSQLLGAAYNTNQMSYDLARLHINELIERREHTNTYDLTPDG